MKRRGWSLKPVTVAKPATLGPVAIWHCELACGHSTWCPRAPDANPPRNLKCWACFAAEAVS